MRRLWYTFARWGAWVVKKIRRKRPPLALPYSLSEADQALLDDLARALDTPRDEVVALAVRHLYSTLHRIDETPLEPLAEVATAPPIAEPIRIGRRKVRERPSVAFQGRRAPRASPTSSGPLSGLSEAEKANGHPCLHLRDYFVRPFTPRECKGTCSAPVSFGKPCFWEGQNALQCPDFLPALKTDHSDAP